MIELVIYILISSLALLLLLEVAIKLSENKKTFSKKNKKTQNRGDLNITLMSSGHDKIENAKLICKIANVSFEQAKKLADNTPFIIKKDINSKEAQKISSLFSQVGGKVEVEKNIKENLCFDCSRLTLISCGENKSEVSNVIKEMTDFSTNKVHEIINNTPYTITLIASKGQALNTKSKLEKIGAKVMVE